MPGLEVLREYDGALQVTYSNHRRGGRIRFRNDLLPDPHALHEWFGAQVSDHGEDAATGTGHDHGH